MTKLKLALVAVALTPLPALAHHGWSGQDNAKATTLEGRIDAVRFHNPHGQVDLTSGDRKWTVTLAPILRMEARGLTADKLKVGQTARVVGHRNLDPARYEVKANEITVDGQTTNLR